MKELVMGTIAGMVVFVVFMFAATAVKGKIDEIPVKPLFAWHAGACITLKTEPESWEQPVLMRVEMVGKRNYLVRKTPESIYRDSIGWSVPFTSAYAYKEVECPTKK